MEEKLAKYRQKQQRQEYIDKTKQKIKKILNFSTSSNNVKAKVIDTQHNDELSEELIPDVTSEVSSLNSDDFNDNTNGCRGIDFLFYLLVFLLWSTLYMLFIQYQFGTVYLIVTALIGIYLNTRTKPRRPGEVSAYSVFNKNCESIDGTLKAEQFEREIRYGYGLLHV